MSSLRAMVRVLLVTAVLAVTLPLATPAVAMDAASFVAKTAGWAQAEERESGVPASVAMAQAILESGWGESSLTKVAKNWFGIKCHATASPLQNGCHTVNTIEYDQAGNQYTTSAKFRKYDSDQNSFVDHGLFLKSLSRYGKAFRYTNNPDRFITEIHLGGYATDPQYANKIISLMVKYDLYQYNLAAPSTVATELVIRPQTTSNVGVPGHVTGLLSPGGSGRSVWTQTYSTATGWSTDQSGTSGSRGQFSLPLIAGTDSVGATRFRVQADAPGGTRTSAEFVVERIRAAQPAAEQRIGGADRYAVAANVSGWLPSVDKSVVVVASGEVFSDALSAGPLAATMKGRLLLTTGTSLPPSVKAELQRNPPKEIIIAGGPGTISEAVKDALSAYAPTSRIGGKDRYAVAAGIAGRIPSKHVVIASGEIFSDSLSAGPLAAKLGGPLLMVRANELPAETVAALRAIRPESVTILGGPSTVSDSVLQSINGVTGVSAVRVGGADRYEVAANVARQFFPTADAVVIASGELFSDGLSGATLAHAYNAPILLSRANCVPAQTASIVASLAPRYTFFVGGPSSVTNSKNVCG